MRAGRREADGGMPLHMHNSDFTTCQQQLNLAVERTDELKKLENDGAHQRCYFGSLVLAVQNFDMMTKILSVFDFFLGHFIF